MNDHQLLCFLTVSRTLNFTTAARELYCTQPALSYQIRSLEKELDLALFERSTTRVALTEAGRAFVPQAEGIYRSILNARTALKGFARRRTLTLRLPPVLLQRDPIYPILMARLHAALPLLPERRHLRRGRGRSADAGGPARNVPAPHRRGRAVHRPCHADPFSAVHPPGADAEAARSRHL